MFYEKGCSDKHRQLQVLQGNQCLAGSLLVWSRYWRGLTFITAWSKEQSYSWSKERADCLILTSYNSLRTWNTSFHRAAAALANSKGPDLSISEKAGEAGWYHLFWEANWNGSWNEVCAGPGCEGLLRLWALSTDTALLTEERAIPTPGVCPGDQRSQAATKQGFHATTVLLGTLPDARF